MSKFKIHEGTGSDGLFLNIHELVDNTLDSKVAYVEDIEPAVDKLGRPFVRMVLRDKSGFVIVGRMFNIIDFESKGRELIDLNKSVVMISFEVSNYDEEKSLKITNLDKIKEEECSREEFIGELEGVLEDKRFLEDLVNELDESNKLFKLIIQQQKLLEGLEYIPIPLYGQRRGGLVKFDRILLNTLKNCLTEEEFIMAKPIVLLTEIYMGAYYMGLTKSDSVFDLGDDISNVIRTNESVWQVPVNNVDKWKPEFKQHYINCSKEGKNLIRSILGFDKPRTFLVHSIFNTRLMLYQQQELREVVGSMSNQSTKYVKSIDSKIVKL